LREFVFRDLRIEDLGRTVRFKTGSVTGAYEQDRDQRSIDVHDLAKFQCTFNTVKNIDDDSIELLLAVEFLASFLDAGDVEDADSTGSKRAELEAGTITKNEDGLAFHTGFQHSKDEYGVPGFMMRKNIRWPLNFQSDAR